MNLDEKDERLVNLLYRLLDRETFAGLDFQWINERLWVRSTDLLKPFGMTIKELAVDFTPYFNDKMSIFVKDEHFPEFGEIYLNSLGVLEIILNKYFPINDQRFKKINNYKDDALQLLYDKFGGPEGLFNLFITGEYKNIEIE